MAWTVEVDLSGKRLRVEATILADATGRVNRCGEKSSHIGSNLRPMGVLEKRGDDRCGNSD